MAARSVWRLSQRVNRTGTRLFCTRPAAWRLVAAACLQRLPVITPEVSGVQRDFRSMLQQVELESSLLSDHELRLLDDAERLSRRQAEDYDSDQDEEDGQETVLAQDLEDAWDQRLQMFQPEPRTRADVEQNLSSCERRLDQPLVLLAQQHTGSERQWLLPQSDWRDGETLRETAQRALDALPVGGLQTRFLGSAPCGVYKYKLPCSARNNHIMGVKVFFFKAILSGSHPAPQADALWLTKEELHDFLKPPYLEKVHAFFLHL